ncbi:MAG: TlpA family protein disulfide reductase [Chitinophagaceae bacterium]|nr:MAG: TlpA family protein disulfide reductase [Chitinophagaceae bacterium]
MKKFQLLKKTLFVFSIVGSLMMLKACGLFQSDDTLTNGSEAPEFVLPDIQGDSVALSDLKGNIILLDFWASWCQPCRRAHPKLVEVYDRFKDAKFERANSFTIVSISIDEHRDRWLRAIEEDKLSWPHHLSDLKGNRSEVAALYNVRSIPASFLLDHNGVIIGVNPDKNELIRQLEWRLAIN